jgi:hypothetical protein
MFLWGDFYNATNVTDFWRRWNPGMVHTVRNLHLNLRRFMPLWVSLFILFLVNGLLHDLLFWGITWFTPMPFAPIFTVIFMAALLTIYIEKKTGISKLKHPLGRAYVLMWWFGLYLLLLLF